MPLPILSIIKFFTDNWKIIAFVTLLGISYLAGYKSSEQKWEAKVLKERNEQLEKIRKLEGDLHKVQALYDETKGKLDNQQAATPIYVTKWKVLKECHVTDAFEAIHDNSALGLSVQPPDSFVDNYNDISCEQAAKVVRYNYLEANKKDAQIRGLQEVVVKLKTAIEQGGK